MAYTGDKHIQLATAIHDNYKCEILVAQAVLHHLRGESEADAKNHMWAAVNVRLEEERPLEDFFAHVGQCKGLLAQWTKGCTEEMVAFKRLLASCPFYVAENLAPNTMLRNSKESNKEKYHADNYDHNPCYVLCESKFIQDYAHFLTAPEDKRTLLLGQNGNIRKAWQKLVRRVDQGAKNSNRQLCQITGTKKEAALFAALNSSANGTFQVHGELCNVAMNTTSNRTHCFDCLA